jgi:hypothetical protein
MAGLNCEVTCAKSMDQSKQYLTASIRTTDNLRTIAHSAMVRDLSRLSLPEIDAAVDLVGKVVPAGNVPGVILNGLARLSGRQTPRERVKKDVNLLLKGVEQVLDRAVYGAFFAGPAAAIWGYQNLLKLTGKDIDDAFPEGTWQFYVEYALREDTARHANETHGFDTALTQHGVRLSFVDRMTAWVMTAIHCLHQYDALLENEWRERVYIRTLQEISSDHEIESSRYERLYREWEKQRPYGRSQDATASEPYPIYRRNRFDRFFSEAIKNLPLELRHVWEARIHELKTHDLPAYQRQMSILSYLTPGPYGETRTAIPPSHVNVCVIYQGHYYLIPINSSGTTEPVSVSDVREQVAALVNIPPAELPAKLAPLTTIKRSAFARLRDELGGILIEELNRLRLSPILLNFDQRPRQLTLADLRQAERGVGDHALTLFDTGETFVFDQSHIFFDGAWGAALAEIMTNEALSWAVYLSNLPAARPGRIRPYSLDLQFEPQSVSLHQVPKATPETSAETETVNIKALLALRRLFRSRNDLVRVTVNDLLVLYRAIHAITYQPLDQLREELETLASRANVRQAALAALDTIDTQRENPAVLIPIDASQRSPRDRLYPMTFEVPLHELDILGLHTRTLDALDEYQASRGDRRAAYQEFDELQRTYLATLAGFGTVLSKAKDIAVSGQSASVGAIRLLAHMPTPLQRLLDQVPGQFDILNDIIKGREVFSNVGAVASTSTLTRFITAKDDNEKKTLAWGVITDATGVMRISLRDFRPHVGLLIAAGCRDTALRITQDYLEVYARGLNRYVRELQRITRTSRETQLARPEELND